MPTDRVSVVVPPELINAARTKAGQAGATTSDLVRMGLLLLAGRDPADHVLRQGRPRRARSCTCPQHPAGPATA